MLGATGFLLFAFTYLYVAFNNFGSLPGNGLGWYCGWAALVSVFLAVVNFVRFSDVKFGFIWLSWVILFSAFFFVLALGGQGWLQRPTGWLAVLQAVTTTTIPGALQLTGDLGRSEFNGGGHRSDRRHRRLSRTGRPLQGHSS